MLSFDMEKNLENIITSHPYNPITFDGSKVCHINRWLVTSSINNKSRFEISAVFNTCGRVLVSKEIENLELEEVERNWRFYISDDDSSFYKRNSPEKLFSNSYDRKCEKYIYCLSGVFCENDIELCTHISTTLPMPIKVWINGRIVFIGTIDSFKKDHIFSFMFKKGLNTVLVEKPMCAGNRRLALTPKWFSFSMRPTFTIIDNDIANHINQKEILCAHQTSYSIYTDKLFYDTNDTIRILVLNNGHQETQDIHIELTYSNSNNIYSYMITAGTISDIPLKTNIMSIVKITVISDDNHHYVFAGDFEKYISDCEMKIHKSILSESDKLSLIFNLKILDKGKGFIHNSIEPIHKYYSHPVLYKLFLFEKQCCNNAFNNLIHNGFNVFSSPIDGENLSYFLQLPKNMKAKYSLIVLFNFDDSSTRIPTAPNRIFTKTSDDAITLTFCGRGDYMNDYLNEFEIMNVIDYVTNRFNVDKKRVHFFGICTGARRGFNFLNKYTGVFSSMFSFAGTPTTNEDLNPKHSTFTYQLCNTDDVIYNGANVIKNALQNNSKLFCVSGFEHEELIDYYCNKNILNLLLQHYQKEHLESKKMVLAESSIKSIYLDQCIVLLSQSSKNVELSSYLSQPLKHRARNYKFPILNVEKTINNCQTNLIIAGDFEEVSEFFPNEIIELADTLINNFELQKVNNYFLMSLEKNSFAHHKKILLIIYFGIESKKELLSLWDRFDVEENFNNRQIVFSNGKYICGGKNDNY